MISFPMSPQHFIRSWFSILLIFTSAVTATSFYGAAFPAPSSFKSSTKFQNALTAFDKAVNETLQNGIQGPASFDGLPLNKTSFSISMFSPEQSGLIYERQHTDPTVKTGDVGSQCVNGDSVFRVGSVSKLFTVYLLLILDGGLGRLDHAVTDYVPELAKPKRQDPEAIIPAAPNWSQITLGDLAAQLAGIARDYALNDVAMDQGEIKSMGLPPLVSADRRQCDYFDTAGDYITCDDKQFIDAIANQAALFAPGYTPGYSNNGFDILGMVIERLQNSSFSEILENKMLKVLGMHGTSGKVPEITDDSVIPINASFAGWDNELGPVVPTAGLFSSTNDLATLGKAILNSTLLPPAVTRRWLKPIAFADGGMAKISPSVAVGAPWEIQRSRVKSRPVDQYTKEGNWGLYASTLILIPDYDVGISAIAASTPRPRSQAAIYSIEKLADEILVPALDDLAREEANRTFSGLYCSSADNSTLRIVVDDEPGLKIQEWTSQGAEVLDSLGTSMSGFDRADFRLYPNMLYSGDDVVGFTGSSRWLTGNYPAWESVATFTYGSVGIDNFVFNLDPSMGRAVSIEPLAYRTRLTRVWKVAT